MVFKVNKSLRTRATDNKMGNEEDHDYTDRRVRSWEDHIQTIASAIIVGLLAWTGINIVDMKENVAVLNNQMLQTMQVTSKVMEHEGRISLLEHMTYDNDKMRSQ